MAQPKKVGASKHTFRMYDDVFSELDKIAKAESRTITAQLDVFLREALKRYKKAQAENKPGNSRALDKAA